MDYSFDLGDYAIEQVIKIWMGTYPPKWIIAAIVEAIFLGRYKAASVDRILFLWCLRGEPRSHFDHEFADLVCGKLLKQVLVQSAVFKIKRAD